MHPTIINTFLVAIAATGPIGRTTLTAQGAPMRVVVETFSSELDGGTGGVSVDAAGNVYVADFGRLLSDAATMGRQVFRIRPSGEAAVFATGLEGASGNAFGPDGNLYQSNIRGNYISRISADGATSVFVREGIEAPVGLVFDPAGTLYVANCGSGSIQRITPDGQSSRFLESDLLSCPNGITIDDSGNLYVANFNDGDVVKIAPDGTASRLAALPGGNNGHLVHHDGSLYVVDRGSHRIFRVSLDGEVTPFAGTGARGRKDGPALAATFSYPNDIAVAPDGSFYVNDIAALEGEHTVLAPMIVRRISIR